MSAPAKLTHRSEFGSTGLWRKALCGVAIRGRDDTVEPTCPICRELVARFEAMEC